MNVSNLVSTMLYEKQRNIRSGVYGLTQKEMAYNSNKIEGSRLSKDHTHQSIDMLCDYFAQEQDWYERKTQGALIEFGDVNSR